MKKSFLFLIPAILSLSFAAPGEGGTLFPAPGPDETMPWTKSAFATSPEWFRRCPGLYVPTAESAGAGMLTFAEQNARTLSSRIDSFRRLPELLDQAQAMGTDTIYLVDYYQGAPEAPPERSWRNKGDYVPRADLGGPEAFKEGIAAVHARGGHIVLYLEAFIIRKGTEVAKAHGLEWTIMTPNGPPIEPYPGTWHLCPACPGWVDYMVKVSRRLVGEYGADGLHIDSYGFQKGWKCVHKDHGHKLGEADVFNQGCVNLLGRVREAVQKENPKAIVMVEGPTRPVQFPHIDGSQDWGIHTLSRRWLWNAAGRTQVFTTGWSLDDLHQILALGHKLSLASYWLEGPEGASCAEWIAAALPKTIPAFKEDKGRRYFAEKHFRALHRWRNAAFLLGVPAPGVDDITPRRWDGRDYFRSAESVAGLIEQVQERAREIDDALSAQVKDPLPAPTAHLRRLLEARRRLSPMIDDGANVEPLAADDPNVAAYLFHSSLGQVLTLVNVGDKPVRVRLTLPDAMAGARLEDELDGGTHVAVDQTLELVVAPHALRFLSRRR